MILDLIDFRLKESVVLEAKREKLSKDLLIIILICVLIIVELPIILLFLKKTIQNLSDYFYIIYFALPILVFFIIFASAVPKVFMIRANNCNIEIGWIKNFIFKRVQRINCNEIKKMVILYLKGKSDERVLLEIFTDKKTPTSISFSISGKYNIEEIARIFLNIGYILNLHTYGAKTFGESSFIMNLSKTSDEKRKIEEEIDNVVFEEIWEDINPKDIKIPYVEVRDLNPLRLFLYRKANFYDLLRIFLLLIFFPFFIIMLFIYAPPKNHYALSVLIPFYLLILYLMRDFIAPIKLEVSKIKGLVTVKRLFIKDSFPLYQMEKIEVKERKVNNSGTYIFQIYVRLKNGRKKLLFFTEFGYTEEKVFEVFYNINILSTYFQKNFGITTVYLGRKRFW